MENGNHRDSHRMPVNERLNFKTTLSCIVIFISYEKLYTILNKYPKNVPSVTPIVSIFLIHLVPP